MPKWQGDAIVELPGAIADTQALALKMTLGHSPEVKYLLSQLNNTGGRAIHKATTREGKVPIHSPLSYQCGTQSEVQGQPPPSGRT